MVVSDCSHCFFCLYYRARGRMLVYTILSLCTGFLVASDNSIKKNSFALPTRAVTHVIDLPYTEKQYSAEQPRISLSPTPHSRCSSPLSPTQTENLSTPSLQPDNSRSRYSAQNLAAAQTLLDINEHLLSARFNERIDQFFASSKTEQPNNEGALVSLFDSCFLDKKKDLICNSRTVEQVLWRTCIETEKITNNNKAMQTKLIRLLNKSIRYHIDFLNAKDSCGNTILQVAINNKNYLLIEACLQFSSNVQALHVTTFTFYSSEFITALRATVTDEKIITLLEKKYTPSHAFVTHYQKSQPNHN